MLISPLRLCAASLGLATLLGLAGCVEAYLPEVVSANANLLVVDGFINGNGATRIKLSRTANINASLPLPAERGATISIVDEMGRRYPLAERGAGSYISDSLLLPAGQRYQLRISTVASPGISAASYESGLVPLKATPPIDKLDWVHQDGQLRIRVATHDPSGQTRFYRWGFAETWEFNSAYQSFLEYRNGIVDTRITPIYTCWRTEQPSIIMQASTASLGQDVLSGQQVLSISDRAERVKIRYSVLVTQAAETAEEFAYYELLRKNTEAVGTINDPLPAQLTGNVHRVGDATEPVLGFVGAHTLTRQRLFIDRQELGLPASWPFDSPYSDCVLGVEMVPDTTEKPQNRIYIPNTRVYKAPSNIPVDYYYDTNGKKAGYTGASRDCVDCRTRGTVVQPSFW